MNCLKNIPITENSTYSIYCEHHRKEAELFVRCSLLVNVLLVACYFLMVARYFLLVARYFLLIACSFLTSF